MDFEMELMYPIWVTINCNFPMLNGLFPFTILIDCNIRIKPNEKVIKKSIDVQKITAFCVMIYEIPRAVFEGNYNYIIMNCNTLLHSKQKIQFPFELMHCFENISICQLCWNSIAFSLKSITFYCKRKRLPCMKQVNVL